MVALGVVGIGHIGGSIAKALLGRCEVLVYDVDSVALTAAKADGCHVVEGVSSMSACEIIVVAAPPGAAPHLAQQAIASNSRCVVTDTCGVRSAMAAVANGEARFIGGHPMAGNEGRGYESADPAVFRGAKWVLTPGPEASAAALAGICDFVSYLGADPLLMDPAAHDRAVAQVSHLPHVLANALLRGVEGDEERLAAGSFRGATRVGGANPELWAELWSLNREHLLARLDGLMDDLGEFRSRLASGSKGDLAAWVREANP